MNVKDSSEMEGLSCGGSRYLGKIAQRRATVSSLEMVTHNPCMVSHPGPLCEYPCVLLHCGAYRDIALHVP